MANFENENGDALLTNISVIKEYEPHFLNTDIVTLNSYDHTYRIDKNDLWKDTEIYSCSGIKSELFSKFPSYCISKNIVKSIKSRVDGKLNLSSIKDTYLRTYLKNDGCLEKSAEDIRKGWLANATMASREGTALHETIEKSIKTMKMCVPSEKIYMEYRGFLHFAKWMNDNNRAVAAVEKCIIDRTVPIAGTVDALIVDRNTQTTNTATTTTTTTAADGIIDLDIYDWKLVKEKMCPNADLKKCKNALKPFNHIKDTKFNQYTIQQNIYRYILEKKENCYNVRINNMYLIQFIKHSDVYEMTLVPRLSDSIITEMIVFAMDKKKNCTYSSRRPT